METSELSSLISPSSFLFSTYPSSSVTENAALAYDQCKPCRRYQYLSFVSFLSKGVYMAPWAHGDVRSLAVEREWDGWDDFFKSGSLMLATVSRPPSLFPSFLEIPSFPHSRSPVQPKSEGRSCTVTVWVSRCSPCLSIHVDCCKAAGTSCKTWPESTCIVDSQVECWCQFNHAPRRRR